jgi:hypothetical protein
MKSILWVTLLLSTTSNAQRVYTGSFIAKLGNDTVVVETYNMINNHLFGKTFNRYPEDQIGVFDFRFNADGSIQHYTMSWMKPDSPYVTSDGTTGAYFENDSCIWFGTWNGLEGEYVNKHAAKRVDFIVGAWCPIISLIEWNCIRLLRSGSQSMPLTLLNNYIGVRQVAMQRGNGDTLIFGGPFLEYTKIITSDSGRIVSYDGTGTPWNYIVTSHQPLDVEEMARRMSKKQKIGNPSPEVNVDFPFGNDTVRLSYGRPSKRGRKIFGGIVPYDSLWRTGAGRPTTLTLPYDIKFGKTLVRKGQYSLYTIPGTDDWTLIFNTDTERWPTDPDRSKDIASIHMKARTVSTRREVFTIEIQQMKDEGSIRFMWDEVEAVANYKVVRK